MKNRRIRDAISLAFVTLVSALPAFGAQALASAIPPEFQATYSYLATQVSTFDLSVRSAWKGAPYPVSYAPQLLTANSDQYTSLLNAGYYNGVLSEMQELQALGATMLTVHINFPVLYQPFYVSNPSQYQSFVDFYTQLAVDVHARGMKLCVESTTAQPLALTQGGSFQPYYESLSWNDYMNGRAQNIVNIAQLVVPDYLSVITEPDSEQSSTGQANAGTVSGSTQLLGTILASLQTAGATSVPIGAGAGTWSPIYIQFIQSFVATAISYVDTHVYPANYSGLTNLLAGATTILAAGKRMAISEAWLTKVNNSEVGVIDGNTVAARNAFSFWGPLDSQFLGALIDFSQYQQLLYLSPFWTSCFSAYLDYNVYGTQTDSQILTAESQAANAARLTGTFTSTGYNWEGRTIPAPDKTPPSVPAAPIATTIGTTGVSLTWTASTDNVGVAAYDLFRDGTLILTSNQLAYYDGALSPGAYYSYSLKALDAAHNLSGLSVPLSVQTIDNIPPSTPTKLTVTAVTSTSVTLQWTPSTDNVGVKQYLILKGTSPTTLTNIAATTADPYTDTHSAPSTRYYYAVKAQDARGNTSPQSNVIGVTTSK